MAIRSKNDAPGPLSNDCCAVCGAALAGKVAVRLGHAGLSPCESCGSWTYLPRLSAAQQAAIHDSPEYYDHPYFRLRRVITPAQRRRCRDLFARLSTALDVGSLRGERFLDIGCDTGTFLKAAQEEFGIIPVGVDVAERAIAEAQRRGVEAYQLKLEDLPPEVTGFRVATAIDLIEHVADPASFLREIRGRLRPGGVAYLETPNIQSVVYRVGRTLSRLTHGRPAGLFKRLFPPQHIQYFTVTSLTALAVTVGFEVVQAETRVLGWDDIAASMPVRTAMAVMQAWDRRTRDRILIWAVLRRPIIGN